MRSSKKIWVAALTALLIAVFLEGTVFNFRAYQTYYYDEIDLTDDYKTQYLLRTDAAADNEYKKLSESATPAIVLNDINCKVNNVYFDLTTRSSYGEVVSSHIQVYMTDRSNENYIRLPAQTVMSDVEETKFLNLVTNGETERLKFNISTDRGETFTVNSIRINVRQGFNINIISRKKE